MAIKGLSTVTVDFAQIDTVQQVPFGTRVFTGQQTFVYVKGVSSGAAGKWATFTEAGVTVLTVADINGPCGIFMSTLDATTKFGWLQIFGANYTADVTDAVLGDALYATATPGRLDDTAVTGDMAHGVTTIVAAASNVAGVFLNYPYFIDVAI